MAKERPSWDKYFMEKAEHAATRATCERLSVGAVLVRNNKDFMTGYNGSLPGRPHCTDDGVGCLMHGGSCKRAIHAEMNIIDRCAKEGISMEGATMYITNYPCPDCMQHLANVGIAEVVYKHPYNHKYENDFHTSINIREYKE